MNLAARHPRIPRAAATPRRRPAFVRRPRGPSATAEAYLGRLPGPLSRVEETDVARRLAVAERAWLEALLASPPAARAAGALADDLASGRLALTDALRNVERDPELAGDQRRRLVRLGDVVANASSPAPEDDAADAQMKARMRSLLTTLGPRDRRILTLRFGLDGEAHLTLEEIGRTLSLTRERVRQIECAALAKLRARCDEQRYRPELDA